MKSPVIIKGNKMGIRLIIDDDANLETIKSELACKLKSTRHYYSNVRPISVTFEGKILTDDETEQILEELRTIGLNIKRFSETTETHTNIDLHFEETGLFYIGNLRNGQTIEAKKSIVIVGNIEQGASVLSEGNIIIIGSLYGNAKAGINGNKDAFVYSF